MKKTSEVDELRSEYDFNSLRVVRRGPGREVGAKRVLLAEDVAAAFPTSEAVNNALRTLLKSRESGV